MSPNVAVGTRVRLVRGITGMEKRMVGQVGTVRAFYAGTPYPYRVEFGLGVCIALDSSQFTTLDPEATTSKSIKEPTVKPKSKSKVIITERPLPPPPPVRTPMIQLDLSVVEAALLSVILGHVGGKPGKAQCRDVVDNILEALVGALGTTVHDFYLFDNEVRIDTTLRDFCERNRIGDIEKRLLNNNNP